MARMVIVMRVKSMRRAPPETVSSDIIVNIKLSPEGE